MKTELLWMVLAAVLTSVAALMNGTIPSPGNHATGTGPQRFVRRAGYDIDTYEDFMGIEPLDDDSWEKLKCKGENLMKAMQVSDAEAGKYWNPLLPSAESQWTDFSDLEGWYWHQVTSYESTMVNFLDDTPEEPGFGIENALNGLGLPKQPSNDPNTGIQIIYIAHADYSLANKPKDDPTYKGIDDQTYKVGSTTYRATAGYYKFGINTSTGAIFAIDRQAPQTTGIKYRTPPIAREGLPSLQRYSDVAWLFWAKHAASTKKLKYFLSLAISNEETQRAVRRALQSVKADYCPWPGTTFSVDSEAGRALLGSPNGRAHGYFLAQHKPQLGGNMYISKIQVFHGDTEPLVPNMVLYVEQPKPVAEKPQEPQKQRRSQRKNAKL
ncbi:hypothetical protein N0V94_007458 [Neodidymelliopsis sp. IMI 364377]|nr:hypothetical protein N0V94_007458 [Neodidymelliopsis sp. IMI 364377]